MGMTALSLTACTTTGTGTSAGTGTGGGSTTSASYQTMSESISKKQSFKLDNSASFTVFNDGKRQVNSVDNSATKIQARDDGNGYNVTINGKSFEFVKSSLGGTGYLPTEDGGSFEKYQYDANHNTFHLGSSELDKDGKKVNNYTYSDTFNLTRYNDTDTGTEVTQGIIGNKTQGTLSGTSTYNGQANFAMMKGNELHDVDAKVSLDVDFAASKVVGKLHSMRDRVGTDGKLVFFDGVYASGEINFDAAVSGNGFSGDMTSNASLDAYYVGGLKGKINGNFYGPDGAEASGSFTLDNSSYTGGGTFQSKK